MSSTITRRTALIGGGTVLLAAALPRAASAQLFGTGQPPAATQFRSVGADVSPLIAHGGGAFANRFGQITAAQMRQVFADRITGAAGAPLLTARINTVYFHSYFDSRPDGFDNIDGDGIVSSGGRVLSSTHILTELSPSYSGGFNNPDIDELRLQSLSYQFVAWLRREMGL